MEEIIDSLSRRLDLPTETVRSASRVFLDFVKQRAGEERFAEIVARVPGLADVMAHPEEEEKETPEQGSRGSGGLLAGLMGQATGMFGGAAQAIAGLQKSGLPLDKAAPFAAAFLDEAEKVVGKETVDQLLDEMPEIKGLISRS